MENKEPNHKASGVIGVRRTNMFYENLNITWDLRKHKAIMIGKKSHSH